MSQQELSERTRKALEEEKARKERIAKKQALLVEAFNSNERKSVLDFDLVSKRKLVTINSELMKHLKDHQIDGVKFMFNACFESLEQCARGEGGGCILAQCMGLGKTFQIVTLVHTLFAHKETKVHKVLVICPSIHRLRDNTVSTWKSEFSKWLSNVESRVEIYEMKYCSTRFKSKHLKSWSVKGGVMIMSYAQFRELVISNTHVAEEEKNFEQINEALFDPGPDLVVFDEGHLLKNEKSLITKAVMSIKTKRKIILTEIPMLFHRLNECYYLLNFIKPDLFGNEEEFENCFARPISNGLDKDSDPTQVRLLKDRSFILHQRLRGIVMSRDYEVLSPLLNEKREYVIRVRMSDVQKQLYQYYLDNYRAENCENGLFRDFHNLRPIWAHPLELKLNANAYDKMEWWKELMFDKDLEEPAAGCKLILLLSVLSLCEQKGDKLVVCSSSTLTLNTIEYFLKKTESSSLQSHGYFGTWTKNKDYFRIDGCTTTKDRVKYIELFNRPDNIRARLLLMTKNTTGSGVTLTGANRMVIYDVSWNPSDDSHSVFRVYRLGQTKPCFIYRFVAQGTMEEKMYDRQMTKLSGPKGADNQQIEEQNVHRNKHDFYYTFDPKEPTKEILDVPEDPILAELLKQCGEMIIKYQDHDDLLGNVQEEQLTEEQRLAAWKKYEDTRNDLSKNSPQPELPGAVQKPSSVSKCSCFMCWSKIINWSKIRCWSNRNEKEKRSKKRDVSTQTELLNRHLLYSFK